MVLFLLIAYGVLSSIAGFCAGALWMSAIENREK